MNNEKVDFSKFGKSFQENLAKMILLDRNFADVMSEVLNVSFFETKYLQAFVELIFKYRDKYGVHPSQTTMITLISTEISDDNEALKKQVKDLLVRVHASTEIDGEEYIKETAVDFCKKQKLKEAIIKSVDLLQHSSFDEISHLITTAINLGQDNKFGYDYVKDFEKRFEFLARHPVSTGWKQFDDIMQGGLGRGELGVVIAGTGLGKSHALISLGAEAVKQGLSVVHYTLELSDTVIARRYDGSITGISVNELDNHKSFILDKVKDLKGSLLVKEYPTKSASTATIKNHLEKLRRKGHKIDMIILDYADLLKPKRETKEKRHDLESIYEELRGIASEFACPMYTCSQGNRSSYNSELTSLDNISEAFSKCFVADFIWTLSRTLEDKSDDAGRFFVAKNRFGPDGIVFPISIDTSRSFIDVQERVTYHKSSKSNKDVVDDQQKIIKEKYNKLMGKK